MSRCADLFTAETDPASFANAGLPLSWNTEESVNSGAVSRSADPSSQQLTRRIKRNELNPLFAEVLGRPFQPIDEGDDLLATQRVVRHVHRPRTSLAMRMEPHECPARVEVPWM